MCGLLAGFALLTAQLFGVACGGITCNSLTNCLLCAEEVSATSLWFAKCRWCPQTRSCHSWGSLYNKCSASQQITEFGKCPAEPPADPDQSEQEAEQSVQHARELLWYAAAGYCEPHRVLAWDFAGEALRRQTAGFEVDAAVRSPSTTAFGYVGHHHEHKKIVVGFKGTSSAHDLGFDLDIRAKTWLEFDKKCALHTQSSREVITHRGFCNYYSSLNAEQAAAGKPSMAEQVENVSATFPDYDVWFVGHSLGGSMASLHALAFALNTGKKPHLITYGQPRTGDADFAALVDQHVDASTSVRVTHSQDGIPHFPQCCPVGSHLGFKCAARPRCPLHHTREVWFPESMAEGSRYRSCATMKHLDLGRDGGEDPGCSDGLVWVDKLDLAGDHRHYFGVKVGSQC